MDIYSTSGFVYNLWFKKKSKTPFNSMGYRRAFRAPEAHYRYFQEWNFRPDDVEYQLFSIFCPTYVRKFN